MTARRARTEFTAHSSSGGPITYNFQGAQNLRVTSDEPSVSIPDLTSIGMALPAATNYTWGTISTPGHQSVDDVASEGLLAGFAKVFLAVLTGGDPGTSGLTQSATRSFTTE